jgi:hypothetical protein
MNPRALTRSLGNPWSVYVIAVLVSALLSCWLSLHANMINPDGICYLQSAAAIGMMGIKAASQLCDQAKWPVYSLLIYIMAQWTHLSYQGAAFLLDGLLSLTTVTAFIYLVHVLGGTTRTLWLSAAVILCAHEFDGVREYIVRDHGFWAFYLLSLIFLVEYFRLPRLTKAVAWSSAMILATLFRIEGTIFLLFIPFAAWLDMRRSLKTRLREFLELNLLLGVFALTLSVINEFSVHPSAFNVSRLAEVQAQLQAGVTNVTLHFQSASHALAQHVLNPYAAKDASIVLFLLLIIWYIYSLVTNISFFYAFLVFYAWAFRLLPLDKPARLGLTSYIFINIIITGAYLAENLFISKRYLIALSLVFMLWVPFALDKLIAQRCQHRVLLSIVILLFLMNAAGTTFHLGSSKSYIREAGNWLQQNVPQQSALYSNDELVMYYSDHFGNAIFPQARLNSDLSVIANGHWKQYDYLALRLTHRDESDNSILKELPNPPSRVFANRRGDEVVIYKIVH